MLACASFRWVLVELARTGAESSEPEEEELEEEETEQGGDGAEVFGDAEGEEEVRRR